MTPDAPEAFHQAGVAGTGAGASWPAQWGAAHTACDVGANAPQVLQLPLFTKALLQQGWPPRPGVDPALPTSIAAAEGNHHQNEQPAPLLTRTLYIMPEKVSLGNKLRVAGERAEQSSRMRPASA